MPISARQMHLAAFLFPPGSHGSAWRLPVAVRDADMDIQSYIHLAKTAERGKLDMMFLQDSAASADSAQLSRGEPVTGRTTRPVRLEPMTLMSAVAAVTSRIGLVATATTTYNDPFTIAEKYLTLDHITGGRGGWNLVTSQTEDEAGNFGLESHVDHALRYERAVEFQEIVVGLWDSWEDGALIRDKQSGRYFDRQRVHALNHKGKHFSVRGPLDVARSPQGRPVIAQAGSSEAGRDLAARTADVVFTAQTCVEDAVEFYQDVKARMVAYGRHPDELKILPGISFFVGETQAEAQEMYERLADMIPLEAAVRQLTRLAGGIDLSTYPPDGPLPDLPPSNLAKARQKLMVDMARRNNWSIRQLARFFSMANGHNPVYGSPTHIADVMEEYFVKGGADGFTMLSPFMSQPIERFVDMVVPVLQRRGLFRTEYEGATLRQNLGLAHPRNRFAGRRASSGLAAAE